MKVAGAQEQPFQFLKSLNVSFFDKLQIFQSSITKDLKSVNVWNGIYVIFTVWWDDARLFAKEIRIWIQETNEFQGCHNSSYN